MIQGNRTRRACCGCASTRRSTNFSGGRGGVSWRPSAARPSGSAAFMQPPLPTPWRPAARISKRIKVPLDLWERGLTWGKNSSSFPDSIDGSFKQRRDNRGHFFALQSRPRDDPTNIRTRQTLGARRNRRRSQPGIWFCLLRPGKGPAAGTYPGNRLGLRFQCCLPGPGLEGQPQRPVDVCRSVLFAAGKWAGKHHWRGEFLA